MKTLPIIQKFYDEITATTKRNEKKEILKRWESCKEVHDLLQITYNPYLTYGVTYNKIETTDMSVVTCVWPSLMGLLKALTIRELSGNAAIHACKGFIIIHGGIYEELLARIFDKNLKIGIDAETINEVFTQKIPTFSVALAHDINKSPTYSKLVNSNPYLITRKLDGVRVVTICSNGEIHCYSRIGNEFTSLDVIKSEIKKVIGNKDNIVFDGELCVIDNDKEDFKAAVSQIKRLNFTMQKPHYKIFDILTLDEYSGVCKSDVYSARLEKAKALIAPFNSSFLSVLGACKYSEDNFIKAQAVVDQKGYEGLILRADAPYKSGRSADLLKVKKFVYAEYKVEDITNTTKLMKGLSGVMEEVHCAKAFIIRHKGNPVDVGSGIDDALRIDMYNNTDNYLGRTITVKYFEETADAFGKPSLRFPIFVGFRDTNE